MIGVVYGAATLLGRGTFLVCAVGIRLLARRLEDPIILALAEYLDAVEAELWTLRTLLQFRHLPLLALLIGIWLLRRYASYRRRMLQQVGLWRRTQRPVLDLLLLRNVLLTRIPLTIL